MQSKHYFGDLKVMYFHAFIYWTCSSDHDFIPWKVLKSLKLSLPSHCNFEVTVNRRLIDIFMWEDKNLNIFLLPIIGAVWRGQKFYCQDTEKGDWSMFSRECLKWPNVNLKTFFLLSKAQKFNCKVLLTTSSQSSEML